MNGCTGVCSDTLRGAVRRRGHGEEVEPDIGGGREIGRRDVARGGGAGRALEDLAAHAADDVARLAGAAEHPRAHHVAVEREAVRRQRGGRPLEQRLRLAFERSAGLGFDGERDEALAREIERLLVAWCLPDGAGGDAAG